MLKELFVLLYKLLTEPAKSWNQLAEKQESNNENFYKSYLYPVLGLIALFSFVEVIITKGTFSVQMPLKIVIKEIGVYFGGFYLSSLILSKYVIEKFTGSKDTLLCERFTGYSSALIYVAAMAKYLFPEWFFPLSFVFVFYSAYIIWTGAIHYLKLEEKDQVKFTVWSSAIILPAPMLIDAAIQLLMPNMKIE